jgi:diguanylate cyclase (GGDEF)-like protein
LALATVELGAAELHKLEGIVSRISNGVFSLCAGAASFAFTLLAFMMVREIDQQIVASLSIGLFALMIVWVATEKPNSHQARAVSSLIERLLAVKTGDLTTPAPPILREEMPALAAAVDGLFDQVRSNLDNVHAMAMYDPVTSLPNRVHFKREGERILKARRADDPLALLFVDLDGFKEVNDSLGHAQGDQILVLVANRLRSLVREEGEQGNLLHPLIARLAGDEFTLLFPSIPSPKEAERIAQRVLAALCAPFEMGGQKIEMGASIGVALCPAHGTELTSLMKAADIAMYHAKASGRSRICLYNAELGAAFERRARLERELRDAVGRGEFDLVFHPQLCVKTGTIVAGEALVRWNHPLEGMKLPDSFISVAEESSLIAEIGDWVATAAAQTLARWQALGLPQRLTYNVSPRQLDRPDFFLRLRRALAKAGAPAAMLELEFTETLAMRCSDAVLAELAALRSEGVSITIDDFGSGYSNLARMKDMPIDRVKLDASLIGDVDRSECARTIVSSVVNLVHGLGAQVVGEGVERKEQLDVLRAIGCDLVQGHAFDGPMDEAEFTRWVGSRADDTPLAMRA